MATGILIIGAEDPAVSSKAKALKLQTATGELPALPFDKTLILTSGTRVPWDLLPAAWNFLERWDAAAPLYRYGVTAADLGTPAERDLTRAIVRDLRVLVYAHELLFIRQNPAGEALIETWLAELLQGPEPRLAFLRAYYRVKPRFCVLPVSWLAKVRAQAVQGLGRRRSQRLRHATRKSGVKLVRVEVAPGRFVKCNPGDEERVRAYHREQHKR